ncbi:PREDICTED: putative glucose-6-phosphate 1-epimerase isoform X2 [Nelumbo nucifera]|uniref:glucose-6-phosphate 1-epimerase n=1 Tax=Nelumbo nucifera TaxID=4432 RepID=A0A1U8AA68_NELNU|nr:PREDICTED: putative glucose-6-phosphate 1-epimerase isoform X2 [Nelumbo nucifera]
MPAISVASFFPTLTYSNLRLRSRTVGVTFANLRQETLSFGVQITEGTGKLPKVVLTSDHGSEAEVYLFGGCITSWKVVNGKDLLFVRPDAVFNGQKPISGGIPHCFPQFGPGPLQQVKLYSRRLSTELIITNTDNKSFSFSTALHTYFHASVTKASVKGLKGCNTLNKDPDPTNPVEGTEDRDVVNFPGFVDCIYLVAPSELQLDNGLGDLISIKNTNWTDCVLWNPYLQMENCYQDFVCVENAKIGKVQLEPEQSWVAEQHLSIG